MNNMGTDFVSREVNSRFPFFSRVSSYCRRKRIDFFIRVMKVTGTERVLDVGGEAYFWESLENMKSITLLNLHKAPSSDTIISVSYQGGTFPFQDNEFDIVFSNSTIEHVGDFKQQKLFASEIHRVAPRHFVQVPSYWFMYEPHAQIPLFQFLPTRLKKLLRRVFTRSPYTTEELLSIRLLTKSEIQKLFPQSLILTERFLAFPKSYYIVST